MSAPDFLVCLDCETPCYTFEWKNDELAEILCAICGNDKTDQFASTEDLEAMGAD